MVSVDTTTMFIGMTKGDTISLSFSATDTSGTKYLPIEGDVLTFAVSSSYDDEASLTKTASYGFTAASPTQTEFDADKTLYYTKSGDTYTRCTSSYVYSSGVQYYTQDMWNIELLNEDTADMDVGKYVYDVQIASGTTVTTIIGQSDELAPVFQLWGEVSE